MADLENLVVEKVAEVVNGTTGRVPATREGMLLAYASIVTMALIPLVLGAFRSVTHHKQQKASGEKADRMTQKDAAMFPLIASAALFGLYIFFKVFSKEHINLLVTVYFFFLGVFALSHLLSPVMKKVLTNRVRLVNFHFQFSQRAGTEQEPTFLIDLPFTSHDLVTLALSGLFGLWYLLQKHWVANNVFGMAFAINGVELLLLNKVMTGCILLGGLFFYDIFWVFGTNVMVTVARSFEAPIKLVFPQDLLEKGLGADNFAMLGLGDIVLPGIFLALLLRFDVHLNRNTRTYFQTGFVAYVVGILTALVVMDVYRHAQPVLLYLVPTCLGFPLLLALLKGDLNAMLKYEDHPETEDTKKAN